jgi:hypothetical protein
VLFDDPDLTPHFPLRRSRFGYHLQRIAIRNVGFWRAALAEMGGD